MMLKLYKKEENKSKTKPKKKKKKEREWKGGEEEKSYEGIMHRFRFPWAELKKKNERMHRSPFPLLIEKKICFINIYTYKYL